MKLASKAALSAETAVASWWGDGSALKNVLGTPGASSAAMRASVAPTITPNVTSVVATTTTPVYTPAPKPASTQAQVSKSVPVTKLAPAPAATVSAQQSTKDHAHVPGHKRYGQRVGVEKIPSKFEGVVQNFTTRDEARLYGSNKAVQKQVNKFFKEASNANIEGTNIPINSGFKVIEMKNGDIVMEYTIMVPIIWTTI
jgi:hypothetical protein